MMNYPTTEEINNAWEVLNKVGRLEVTFNVALEKGALDNAINLIRGMGNFNNKDNMKIAKDFLKFFNQLPVNDYGDRSIHKDVPAFGRVILRGDDTIMLIANGKWCSCDWNEVEKLVKKYGKKWCADEMTIRHEELEWGFEEHVIRFWWD